jgi:hypothetical protein
MSTPNGTAPAETPARPATVHLAGREVTIERVSGRKASRAFSILRQIGKDVPGIIEAWGKAQTDFEATHGVELTRVQAHARFAARPLLDDGVPVRHPEHLLIPAPEGSDLPPRVEPHPRAGELVMAPSPLDGLTEEDWNSSGGVMRMPESPSWVQLVAAVFPMVLDAAEESVYTLLALFVATNDEVKRWRRSGNLDEELTRIVDELLDDALADELLELAVVCGEVVDDQFVSKAADLGDRLGKALRLVGLSPERLRKRTPGNDSQTPPEASQTSESGGPETPTSPEPESTSASSSRPTSPTDSDGPTGGTPTPSSTSPTSSSSPSEGDLTPSAPG